MGYFSKRGYACKNEMFISYALCLFPASCGTGEGIYPEMKGLLSDDLSLGATKGWIVQTVKGVSV